MKILSIDPSTKSSGIALFQNLKLTYYTCIQSTNSDSLYRIKEMANNIQSLYQQYQPDIVVLEQVLPQDVKHNQTVYKALIYLQAAIVLKLHNYHANIIFSAASHWRSLVGITMGKGIKRDNLKAAAQEVVNKKYNISVNNDVADAICIGLAYINETQSAF